MSGTSLLLSGGTHTLNEGPFCVVENLENVSIRGRRDSSTAIYCDSSNEIRRGIMFLNITNLSITDVTITNCGEEIPDRLSGYIDETFTYLGPRQRGALILVHCTNVILENVVVDKSFGFSILALTPLGETVVENLLLSNTNQHSSIDCVAPTERYDMYCAGSGAVFLYADTNPTNGAVMQDEPTSLTITNSTFINNTNLIPVDQLIELISILGVGFETQPITLFGSSGLAVFFGQRNFFVDAKIINTAIISCRGNVGTMTILHYNTVRMSHVLLDGVVVADNHVGFPLDLSRGGGLLILVTIFVDALSTFPSFSNDIYDIMEITRSTFARNSAYNGGGIMFYTTPQNVSDIRLVLTDTTFVENVAQFGAALNFFQFQFSTSQSVVYIYMEDIVAVNNTYFNANVSRNSPENSAVFLVSHGANITLVGSDEKGSLFLDNDISVLGTVGTSIILRGNISFIGNRGYVGGAISLLDTSILYIHNSSSVNFVQNSAFTRGGAIYSNTLGSAVTETCAIQFYSETRISLSLEELQFLDIYVLFSNNSARVAGNSVFANPLYNCFFLPLTSIDIVETLMEQGILVYREVFQFVNSVGNGLAELNSEQEEICICKNGTFVAGDCGNTRFHQLDREVLPGETFVVFLDPIDSAGIPVASLLYSELSTDSSAAVELGPSQLVRSLPGTSKCIAVKFTIFAPENSMVHLNLFATVGGPKASIEVNITSCPPGFTLGNSDGRQQCMCSDFVLNTLHSTCNLTSYTVARPENYWLGTTTENGSEVLQFISTCPIDYCRDDITDVDLQVPDQICVSGRTGTLCGACKDELSAIFGPAECRDCSNAWLATLLLYAVAGVLMVLVAFLLDLTITHGTITGVFFYANIVRVNSNIFFRAGRDGFLFFCLSWLNLEVGFPLCFYDGMSESAKLGLQYVFPAYIILILSVIVFLSQRSLIMQRILSQFDGTHALVSIFYISFLKLLRSVIDTVTLVTIVTENRDNTFVWFFDGTQRITSAVTVSLIIIGFLTLFTFILPYVILVTFSTHIQRLANSPRLNAYFDASLAPYKDNFRYWFGARLILTCVLYLTIANRGTDNPTLTLTLQISFLVGFAILQAFLQPFKKLGMAILDMSFMINLIALTIGTSYTVQAENRNDDQNILVNFSITVTLITYVGIVFYHAAIRLYRYEIIKRKTDQFVEKVKNLYESRKRNVKEIAGREQVDVKEEEGGEGAPQGVKYLNAPNRNGSKKSPTSSCISLHDMTPAPDDAKEHLSSSQLREPVLDFLDVPELVSNRRTA